MTGRKVGVVEYQLFRQSVLVVIPTEQRRGHIHLFTRVLGVTQDESISYDDPGRWHGNGYSSWI